MTCWPRISLRRAAMMRPTVSTGPPAAYGTTTVTGRVGQSCAWTHNGNTSANAAAPTNLHATRKKTVIALLQRLFDRHSRSLHDLAPLVRLAGDDLAEVL